MYNDYNENEKNAEQNDINNLSYNNTDLYNKAKNIIGEPSNANATLTKNNGVSNATNIKASNGASAKTATGGAKTSSAASAASATEAAGTTGSTVSSMILPILAIVAIVLLIIFFLIGAVTTLTEGGAFSIASGWYANTKLKTETKVSSVLAQIQDFFGADGHFGFNVTKDVDVSKEKYDENNEFDQGYINQYKLMRLLLKNAYNKAVDEIKNECDNEDWEKDKTLKALEDKYPNGYEDVYKDINYGDLMNVLDFGFDTGFYTNDESITASNPLAVELMKNKFTLDYEENGYYKYFYKVTYEEKTENIIENIPVYGYLPGSSIETIIGYQKSEKTVAYVEPTINVYCWNDIYEMLGVDANSKIKDGLTATYKDKMDDMLKQTKINCSDVYGKPRTIYSTLNLNSTCVQWSHSFSSETIGDALKPEIIETANGDVPMAIYKALKNAGFTHEGACGMIGNIYAENHFKTDWTEGDQGSSGICQWRGSRKIALMTYADAHGYEYDTLEAQLGYLIYELPTQCSGHYNDIKTTTNIEDATGLVARYFERCSNFASKEDWQKANVPYEWSRYGWNARVKRFIIDYNTRYSAAIKYYEEYKEN